MIKPFYNNFLALDPQQSAWDEARYVIIQAPLEKSTRLQHGTSEGPQAILRASEHISRWDSTFEKDVSDAGIHCLSPTEINKLSLADALIEIEKQCDLCLDENKWPLILGGEQSVGLAAFKSFSKGPNGFAVLSLDSRIDCLDKVLGSKNSHLSFTKRCLELGASSHVWGYRRIETEEAFFLESAPKDFSCSSMIEIEKHLDKKTLPQLNNQNIFLSIDLSVLDPSVCPGTSRPEPGGLSWAQLCDLVVLIFEKYNVIGASICELCPLPQDTRSEYLAAQLAYKIICANEN